MKKNNTLSGKKHILLFALFSLLALAVLAAIFYLPAREYYASDPPLGNDFYHSFNLISFIKNNLSWPQASWRDIWHFGGPAVIAYPWLNFYLVLPAVHFFGLFKGTIFYFLGCLFLYGFFAYFLFYRLSKSWLLSLGLAAALIWSASTWRLIAAGSLTLTANQFFLVLMLLFIIIYLQNKKKKYLALSGLGAGLSVISQSGSGFPFIIPLGILFIISWWSGEDRFWLWGKKIRDFVTITIISLLVSFYYVYYTVINVLSSRGDHDVFDWMKTEAFSAIVTKTNPIIFLLLGILILAVIVLKRFKYLKTALPVFLGLAYLALFNLTSIYGLNPFGSSLAPAETWYIFTLLIAMLVAVFWQAIFAGNEKIKTWLSFIAGLAALFILLMPFGYYQTKDLLASFKETNLVCGVEKEESVHQALIKNDYVGLTKSFPAWFEGQDRNHRFFSLSWCVELWFNAFYKMPLTGGYDTLLTNKINRNYINWTNEIFNGTWEQKKVAPEIIKNNMLFHIDWLAGRYLEQIGDFNYLKDDQLFKLDNQPSGYRVYEFQPEIISPIVRPTNTPTLLIVSDQEGYDTVIRILAQENLNSRHIIPVKGPENIDDIKDDDLKPFDAVFLYDYHYKKENNFRSYPQKPWLALANYVKEGGKLFLEGGSDVKESDINNLPGQKLPEVFPVNKTTREPLGIDWQIKINDNSFFAGVDINLFDPLVYQETPWKVSSAELPEVNSGAEIIFTQKDKAVLVLKKIGQGEVIWSGLNLPYHIKSYNNLAESRLFRNILKELVALEEEIIMPFDFARPKSESISLTAEKYKGVLFKESFNSGWQARQGEQKLNIYPAGFNFMYIPAKTDGKVFLYFRGETKYQVMFIVSLLTVLAVFISLAMRGKLTPVFRKLFKLDRIKKTTKSWWEKDEE